VGSRRIAESMRPACMSGATERMKAMIVKLRLIALSPTWRDATAKKAKPRMP